MASEERFGYEWKKYAEMTPVYEEQFRNWTSMGPEDFTGKDVLDAGCGMGRNSYWPLRWGAKSVTAFDNDEQSLTSACATLAEFLNATVVRSDISHTPWENEFDLVLCIGVLHHVRNPRLALENLVRALRPGGKVVVWVYSYEGNELKVPLINALRVFTSWLPLPLVHVLAYIFSLPLYLLIKLNILRGPYYRQLATFDFWHVQSIVFDQLIPSVANYWREEEVRDLTEGLALSQVSVTRPDNNMGWILTARKK